MRERQRQRQIKIDRGKVENDIPPTPAYLV